MADMNLSFLKYSNPHRNSGGQPMDIAIHAGFYAYLFQDHKVRKAQLRSGTQSARFRVDHFTIFDKILHEVDTQLKINPNFNVFVTGHSLGGALATLFSFHLAALNHPLINKNTITCISVASPKLTKRWKYHTQRQVMDSHKSQQIFTNAPNVMLLL